MEDWWKQSQSEENLHRLFLSTARSAGEKKDKEEKKALLAWQNKQATRATDHASWNCPRDKSTRLRHIAARNYNTFDGDETVEETAVLTKGDRIKATRIAKKFIHWF